MLRKKIENILDKAMGYQRGYPCGDTTTRDNYVSQILAAVREGIEKQKTYSVGADNFKIAILSKLK